MLLIGPGREEPAKAHGDRPGGDLRQPRQNNYRRAHLRPGKAGRQSKWNGEAVGHPDYHIADGVAGRKVMLAMRCCRHLIRIRAHEPSRNQKEPIGIQSVARVLNFG